MSEIDAWGGAETRFFFELTPDRVLAAVESSGLRCTGRCTALNSFENRVYEIELEEDESEGSSSSATDRFARRRVVKFYRPGRWNETQILEEHEFLLDLQEAEIPVVAPLAFSDGRTLHKSESGIYYGLFPKVGGRAPDELDPTQLQQVGRLLARIHQVGAKKPAANRVELSAQTYGRKNLESLLSGNWVPLEYRSRYETVVGEICTATDQLFRALPPGAIHRIHGDCHLGNLLWTPQGGAFFLDFDDMLRGPAVQDIWLIVPGRDDEARRSRDALLEGYEEMRPFDWTSLRLVEPLRALRFVHYSAWLARRWNDPAFPLAFPQFGSHQYWAGQTQDLEDQLRLIRQEAAI